MTDKELECIVEAADILRDCFDAVDDTAIFDWKTYDEENFIHYYGERNVRLMIAKSIARLFTWRK